MKSTTLILYLTLYLTLATYSHFTTGQSNIINVTNTITHNHGTSAGVLLGKDIIYSGRDEQGGELWKTDGTAAGTVIVKDINVGPEASDPFGFIEFNGVLLFRANDGVNGSELWTENCYLEQTMASPEENFGKQMARLLELS